MRKLYASLLLIISSIVAEAQLTVNSLAPNFTVTDLTGETWVLENLLDSGYSVLICLGESSNMINDYPSYPNQFNNLYYQLGPDSSQNLMVFFFDTNLNTDNVSLISSGLPSKFDFPTINCDASLLNTFNFSLGTEGYCEIICANGIVKEQISAASPNIYSESFLIGCENATIQNDLGISYCGYFDCFNQIEITIVNYGNQTVYNIPIEIIIENDTVFYFLEYIDYSIDELVITNYAEIHLPLQYELNSETAIICRILLNDDNNYNNYYFDLADQNYSSTSHSKLQLINNSDNASLIHFQIQGEFISTSVLVQDIYLNPMQTIEQDIYLMPNDCYNINIIANPDISAHLLSVASDGTLSDVFGIDLLINEEDIYPMFSIDEIVAMNLTGLVFDDLTLDGIKDSFEPGIGNIEVHLGNQITYTDANGQYTFPDVNIADYTEISVVYDNTLWPTTTTGATIPIDNAMMSNFNFGLSTSEPFYLLSASSWEPWFFCGFDGELYLTVQNDGNTAASGTLTATLDPLLTNTGASPAPLSFDGATVVWDIANLPVGGNAYFYVNVVAPTFEQMGQTLNTTLNIVTYDSDGTEVANNSATNSGIVNCSYDPNDVSGFPTGETDAHFIHNGTQLEYVVRFQNTGNYQAFDIRVDNQLDSDLDFSTFEFVGSSHACVPVFNSETGFIQFYFNDINLPDSTTNEAASHGWLRYRISPQTPLAEMSTIENTAYIYFDFNPAVVTNTYVHTISDLYFGLNEMSLSSITIYPNPADQSVLCDFNSNSFQSIHVCDLNGKILMKETNLLSSKNRLSTTSLADGVYIIEAVSKYGLMNAHARLIVQH